MAAHELQPWRRQLETPPDSTPSGLYSFLGIVRHRAAFSGSALGSRVAILMELTDELLHIRISTGIRNSLARGGVTQRHRSVPQTFEGRIAAEKARLEAR